ncbi:MAG TPA: MFS transporter [Burkholderiales bacterium]
MNALARTLNGRMHYAWITAAIVFMVLLVAAGVRSMPGVLMVPLENAFGWSRSTISAAVAVNLALYGLLGPFAGAAMQRFGIRRMVVCALALLSVAIALSTQIHSPWQLVLTWGFMVGTGSGITAAVLAATVVNRWFRARRGVVMGALTAATATGQLVFLPLLASIVQTDGWQGAAWTVAGAVALMIPLCAWLIHDRPQDVGLLPYGATADDPGTPAHKAGASTNPVAIAFAALGRAVRVRAFWILFGSFFICGLSTNGLIGTHFISFCIDGGMPEVRAAGVLAMMGVFDLLGTTLSGWLSDRYDNRWLLFWYYALRGLSLLYLPYSDLTFWSLGLFGMFYGLDWIATVPPTVRLATDAFGERDAPVVFGWIFTGHQLGAATAAFGAGAIHAAFGAYTGAFLFAGAMCGVAALAVLSVKRTPRLRTAIAV